MKRVISYILFPIGALLALIGWIILTGPDMGFRWMESKLPGAKP